MVKEPLLPRSSQAISQGGAQAGIKPGTQAGTQTGVKAATQTGAPSASANQLAIKYVDLPELPETFADSVNAVSFDGQTLRVEFGVTRFDQSSSRNALLRGGVIPRAGSC